MPGPGRPGDLRDTQGAAVEVERCLRTLTVTATGQGRRRRDQDRHLQTGPRAFSVSLPLIGMHRVHGIDRRRRKLTVPHEQIPAPRVETRRSFRGNS